MIQFDNGPADGDYVRYIERLVAERLAIPAWKPGEGLSVAPSRPTTNTAFAGIVASPDAPATGIAPRRANAVAAAAPPAARDAGAVPRNRLDAQTLGDVVGVVAGAAIALFGFVAPQPPCCSCSRASR